MKKISIPGMRAGATFCVFVGQSEPQPVYVEWGMTRRQAIAELEELCRINDQEQEANYLRAPELGGVKMPNKRKTMIAYLVTDGIEGEPLAVYARGMGSALVFMRMWRLLTGRRCGIRPLEV